MWLCTRHGFFSTVLADQRPGQTDVNVMIRVRDVQHLINLKTEFPELLDQYKIVKTPDRDYAARIVVPDQVFVKVTAALADDVNYRNFKGEVTRLAGSNKPGTERYRPYLDFLHAVWELGVRKLTVPLPITKTMKERPSEAAMRRTSRHKS